MRINIQKKEKQTLNETGHLQVHSVWETIQGEGPYNGTPAVFVRLTGCNLDCPGCDTDYTSIRTVLSPSELLDMVLKIREPNVQPDYPTLIVLTGGEPFRQNFAPFVRQAVYEGYRVQVETNGTLWFDEIYPARFDVVCSPKSPVIRSELKRYITALKYVVQAGQIDPSDGLPLSVLDNRLKPARPWPEFTGEIFVQPYDEAGDNVNYQVENDEHTKAAIESCMKFGYRLCLQVHKIVGMP